MDLVIRSDVAHNAEHFLYLAVGYLYFLPIVGAEPFRWRISMPGRFLMLLVGMHADTLVGVGLLIQDREVFSGCRQSPTAVADLHRGGLIMFAGSDLVMAALAVAVCVAMVHDPRWRVGWATG